MAQFDPTTNIFKASSSGATSASDVALRLEDFQAVLTAIFEETPDTRFALRQLVKGTIYKELNSGFKGRIGKANNWEIQYDYKILDGKTLTKQTFDSTDYNNNLNGKLGVKTAYMSKYVTDTSITEDTAKSMGAFGLLQEASIMSHYEAYLRTQDKSIREAIVADSDDIFTASSGTPTRDTSVLNPTPKWADFLKARLQFRTNTVADKSGTQMPDPIVDWQGTGAYLAVISPKVMASLMAEGVFKSDFRGTAEMAQEFRSGTLESRYEGFKFLLNYQPFKVTKSSKTTSVAVVCGGKNVLRQVLFAGHKEWDFTLLDFTKGTMPQQNDPAGLTAMVMSGKFFIGHSVIKSNRFKLVHYKSE